VRSDDRKRQAPRTDLPAPEKWKLFVEYNKRDEEVELPPHSFQHPVQMDLGRVTTWIRHQRPRV
jgi:hypothetical protein